MSPLRGLALEGTAFLQRCHPYGVEEITKNLRISTHNPVNPASEKNQNIFGDTGIIAEHSEKPYIKFR